MILFQVLHCFNPVVLQLSSVFFIQATRGILVTWKSLFARSDITRWKVWDDGQCQARRRFITTWQ